MARELESEKKQENKSTRVYTVLYTCPNQQFISNALNVNIGFQHDFILAEVPSSLGYKRDTTHLPGSKYT